MPWTFSWTASTGTRPCSRRATMLPSLLPTRRDDIRKAPRHLMDQPGQVCLQPRATALPDPHTCETQHSSDQPGASPVFFLFGTENCLEMDEHSSSSRSAAWSHSHAPSSQRCIVRTCFVEKRSSNTPTTCSLVRFLPHVPSHLALQSARANICARQTSPRYLSTDLGAI